MFYINVVVVSARRSCSLHLPSSRRRFSAMLRPGRRQPVGAVGSRPHGSAGRSQSNLRQHTMASDHVL